MYQRAKHLFLAMVVAAMGLPLLSSCYGYEDKEEEAIEEAIQQNTASYINLTVTVSNGAGKVTRADAGENGDGREAGFERENRVSGITLILYQDATAKGIDGAANLPLQFVEYYPVTRCENPATAGTQYEKTKVDEATYTTGNQLIGKNRLDFTATYYAIAIANADLRGFVSNLGQVRDYIFRNLYEGNEQSAAKNCTNFIMSSEEDHAIDFSTITPTVLEGNNVLYDLTPTPIRIERLAARIDFSSANAVRYNETYMGYEYNVDGSTNDKFVVTGLMPFNLNSSTINSSGTTLGGEYLIKRLAKAVTESPEVSYLIDENDATYKYVLDPATQSKTSGELTYFKNTLTSLLPSGKTTLEDITSLSGNAYYKSVESLHNAVNEANTVSGFVKENEEIAIIAYPMENTLWESSRLFTCATGLAIEGVYINGSGTAIPRVYYGYLRHQGTASSYSATLGTNMSSTETTTAANCMEFGIVRNNIYRVSIQRIGSSNGTIKIKIEEKHWRHVDNPMIYI